jgi:hypothetical protein
MVRSRHRPPFLLNNLRPESLPEVSDCPQKGICFGHFHGTV